MAAPTNAPRAKKVKKPASPARLAADAKFAKAQKDADAAKSDQEKRVTGEALKVAREELKALKFKEIGTSRIKRFVKLAKQLENVANPNAYSWSPEQGQKAVAAINAAVKGVTDKLLKQKAIAEDFSL